MSVCVCVCVCASSEGGSECLGVCVVLGLHPLILLHAGYFLWLTEGLSGEQ